MKLNVGCGKDIREGWVNVDKVNLPGVNNVIDIESSAGWPLGHDAFEEIYMSHVLEHLAQPLVAMENLWRAATPGGRITIKVPYGSSDNAWEDPTHIRPYFLGSCQYFSQLAYAKADYGYRGDWRHVSRTLHVESDLMKFSDDLEKLLLLIHRGRNLVREMTVVLEAVKPIRDPHSSEKEHCPITFDFRP